MPGRGVMAMPDTVQPDAAHADPTGVTVTANAARRIAWLAAREKQPSMLRVSVAGGGCSGFQYVFDFETQRNDDDLVIAEGDAKVVIDSTSLELLKGSTIDFVEEMVGSSFQVRNPNAASSCGCGTSFSV